MTIRDDSRDDLFPLNINKFSICGDVTIVTIFFLYCEEKSSTFSLFGSMSMETDQFDKIRQELRELEKSTVKLIEDAFGLALIWLESSSITNASTKCSSENPTSIMTLKEVAAYLKVSERSIRNWISNAHFPPLHAGEDLRFNRAEVDEWMMRNRNPSRAAKVANDRVKPLQTRLQAREEQP